MKIELDASGGDTIRALDCWRNWEVAGCCCVEEQGMCGMWQEGRSQLCEEVHVGVGETRVVDTSLWWKKEESGVLEQESGEL